MSSLAASRADNFYFPPEWRPEYGGISKFAGSKGANQYEQFGIIRFELPFDGWCLKCDRHLSRGLRFNAKKDKAGKYFTTQIWSFGMKCPNPTCPQKFVVVTDPENGTYNYSVGLRKHEQDFVPEFDDGLIVADNGETRNKIVSDPMFRIEHENEDKKKVKDASERMSSLAAIRDDQFKNDYDMNSLLRRGNRDRKRKVIEQLDNGKSRGLPIPLLDATDSDVKEAKLSKAGKNRFLKSEEERMIEAKAKPLFSSSRKTGSSSSKSKSIDNTKKRSPSSSSKIAAVAARDRHLKALKTQSRCGIDPSNFKLMGTSSATKSTTANGSDGAIRKKENKEGSSKSALDMLSGY